MAGKNMVPALSGTIAGQPYSAWLELWGYCHEPGMAGPILRSWPNGEPLLRQPAVMVETFGLITQLAAAEKSTHG